MHNQLLSTYKERERNLISYIILLAMTVVISVAGFVLTGNPISLALIIPVVVSVVLFGRPVPKPGELVLFSVVPAEERAQALTIPQTAGGGKPLLGQNGPAAKAKDESKDWGTSIIKKK